MNRIRGLLLVGMLLTTAVLPIQAYAQSATAIKYGDVAKGEITASKASLSFTFKAAANDMVVLKMKQDGLDSNVAPSLAVIDKASKPTILIFNISPTLALILKLPSKSVSAEVLDTVAIILAPGIPIPCLSVTFPLIT